MKYKNSFNIVVKDLIPIPEFIKLVLNNVNHVIIMMEWTYLESVLDLCNQSISEDLVCSFHKQQIQCNHLQERQNGDSCSSGSVKITAVAISSTKKTSYF